MLRVFSVTKKRSKAHNAWKTRALSAFFCLGLLFSMAETPVAVYADAQQTAHNHAAPLSQGSSAIRPAADSQQNFAQGQTQGQALGTQLDGPGRKEPAKHDEIVSKRTQNTKTFDLGNGKVEVRNYMGPVHFKENGKWKQIDTSLVEDTNAAESTSPLGKGIAWLKGKVQSLHTYKLKANDWQAKFAASNDAVGMVRIETGERKISFSPRGATANVLPDVHKNDQGVEMITYKDLWPGVDVVYTVKNEMLKEEILLKDAAATTDFSYDVAGADLVKNANGGFDISGTQQRLTELSVTLQKSGPTSEHVISQDYKEGVMRITLDKAWLKKQAADQFPVVIDPSWTNGGTVSWGYTAYKSDGYVCSSSVCFMNAGELYDNGWKNWRTVYCTGDISFMAGKRVTYAGMYLQQANRSYLAGYGGGRIFWSQHANAFAYWGMDGGAPSTAGVIDYGDALNMTSLVQFEVDRGDWGPCWSLWGEESPGYGSYKGFDPDISYMHYEYSTTPATPSVVTPQNGQTFTDPQPSFQINPVGDVDGDPVQYYYRIATGADGETGTVINSGDTDSTQWTVPDGVLQDGETYYLHVYSRDTYAYSAASAPIKFTIDSRRGKDKTQTYDTVGPASIDLTNGNVSTSISSHDTTALGGSLGVSLDYNSPYRSRPGLVGTYWNNTTESNAPVLSRVDKNINFNWVTGSPSAGIVNPDSFSAQWKGFFVAPRAGTYYFGGSNDDGMTVTVNSQVLYNQGCYSGACYDMSKSVTLTAGQIVPIQVDYVEGGGTAYALLYVKGAVAEQVVPSDWLQTGARQIAQPHGLTGSYYANNTGYNLDASDKQLLVRRVDSVLNFNWGTGSPVPGTNSDFMARWAGYITLPGGDYNFGSYADDGVRISIAGTTVADNYSTCCSEQYGQTVHYNAGVYPIQIDYYDIGGPASLNVLVKVNNGAAQTLPTSWLSPSAQVLPAGWQLGMDPDGDLSYDHLSANASSVTLSDSTGDTHIYTWANGAYKPPVNEDGQLTRSADGKYTLIDTDGRTYVFNADGTLNSVTSPTDDRKPAALQYSYEGTPSHLAQITDGVDPARYAKIYYAGDGKNGCVASTDAGYIDWSDQSVSGYICAVKTNDGRVTSFYYAAIAGNPQLALVVKPGDERTSYQYDPNGMMLAVRDTLAEDAIRANIRANDDSTLTQISYDDLGRAIGVTAPAANAGDARQQQTFSYTSYAMPLVRYINPSGDRYVTTGSAPMGYTPEPHIQVSMLTQQEPGTHALYSCRVNGDQFVSQDSNCEGQVYIGLLGYAYDNATADGMTAPIYRCTLPGDHFVSQTSNCEGFNVEGLLGYVFSGTSMLGSTQEHIVGDAEPNGYTRKVEYDATFRTAHDTDVTGKQTWQQWDPIKDLLYSTTDATGLKSTTIYDGDDRPTDSYGPGPKEWFGTDNKPLSTYASQVPRTTTGYDEGINGLAVSWYDYKSANSGYLSGAPRLHTTSFDAAARSRISMDSANSSFAAMPITKSADAQGVGFRATGKFVVPTTGTYTFTVCHDDALRLAVNDKSLVDDWSYVGASKCSSGTTDTLNAGSFVRISMDYANVDNAAYSFSLNVSGAATVSNSDWGTMLKPDYSLQTSQTVYGAPTTPGNTATETSTTNYGATPEYGLVQSASTDATGLNLTATSSYETPGSGFLRQTSSSLPGGATTNYTYYGATETRQNPCDSTQTFHEGGMLKLKTEPDPDGAGAQTGRTTETVYDDAGKVVATRYNSDTWTCTTYDSRERVATTSVPAFNGAAARSVTNNYAVGGNPLITSSSDASGTITVQTDLLGRNVQYTDAKGNVTTSTYDAKGHLSSRTSPLGLEEFVYDNVDRLTDQKLDGVVYAHVTYDQFSRIDNVTYPAAGQQKLTYARDTLGRLSGVVYTGSTGSTTGPGPNLVTNPSLEQADSTDASIPANWQTDHWGDNAATFTYSADSHSDGANGTGTKSVKTELTAYVGGDAKWYFTPVTVTPNTNYTYTDWYKANVSSYAVVQFTYADGSHTYSTVGNPSASSTWKQTTYSFTTPANTTKVTMFHLISQVGWLELDDVDFHQTQTTIPGSAGTIASDQVTRAVTGDITGGTELEQAKSYSYDTAGRLVGATVAGNTYTYGYGAQDASCTGLTGSNANAGQDSNRTTQTINGVATTFCYDQADRLISSSDSKYTGTVYDAHGNTTSMGSGANLTTFQYDSSDRNSKINQGSKSTTYTRDVQGRIVARSVVNSTTTVSNYGFTASGDTPDFVKDTSGNITEKYLTLPGDVMLTIRPGATGNAQKTYSLPNIHGDIFATTDASGTLTGTFQTGPFGEQIGSTTPNNTANGSSFSYVGKNEKFTETNYTTQPMQMGARVYVPGVGRFLSVDPVQGGTPNNYVYPVDSVNDFDLTGNCVGPLVIICIEGASALLSAFLIAQASSNYQRNPSTSNLLSVGLSAVPGAGAALGGSQKGLSIITRQGAEVSVGSRLRISPLGKSGALTSKGKPNIPARLPHIHYQPKNAPKKVLKFHRPWENKKIVKRGR